MQRLARKAYVPGLAALLVACVAGCTSSGDDSGAGIDAKAGEPSVSAAPPGRYRTLPEPCGSVPLSALKRLLPGVDSLPADQQEKVYAGTPAVTYDTDRRVGCSWKADAPDASHQLALDIERVVSYDPTVSDESQAQDIYTQKEIAAHLPTPATATPTPTPTPTPTGTGSGTGTGTGTGSGTGTGTDAGTVTGTTSHTLAQPGSGPKLITPSTGTSLGAPTAPSTPPPGSDASTERPTTPGLQPRLLEGLGNAAFLNDVLTSSGAAMDYRTVSVVFRTSNVIVTLRYTEQPSDSSVIPDSKNLQDKAQALAKELGDQLNE